MDRVGLDLQQRVQVQQQRQQQQVVVAYQVLLWTGRLAP